MRFRSDRFRCTERCLALKMNRLEDFLTLLQAPHLFDRIDQPRHQYSFDRRLLTGLSRCPAIDVHFRLGDTADLLRRPLAALIRNSPTPSASGLPPIANNTAPTALWERCQRHRAASLSKQDNFSEIEIYSFSISKVFSNYATSSAFHRTSSSRNSPKRFGRYLQEIRASYALRYPNG